MGYSRCHSGPDAHALEASAGLALACAYSTSAEYEAELIQARRKAGVYGPRRHQQVILTIAAAGVMAGLLAALFAD